MSPTADGAELRAAYRRQARKLHPDLLAHQSESASDERRRVFDAETNRRMADLNTAWETLSDPARRRRYDAVRTTPASEPNQPRPEPAPGPTARAEPARRSPARQPGWRREAWLAGIRVQIRRLGNQAARSATQTLLLKSRDASRADYEAEIHVIVDLLAVDTGGRVREARAAGAAPLDLGIVASLIGLRVIADGLEAASRVIPPTRQVRRRAAMVDRMWDTLAHELPREIVIAVGDNPHIARRLS